MEYRKTVRLKDGRICVIRNGIASDGAAALDVFRLTHAQTDFLLSYPNECEKTAEQEAAFLQNKTENPREVELVAEIDGAIVGLAGIDAVGTREKIRHRADFGISIDRAFWGLGIGRALTEVCVACAKRAGYLQLELSAVADNVHALALYESVGFREYGRNPMGFRSRVTGFQTLVEMRLELVKRRAFQPRDEQAVCDFLNALNEPDRSHIHWNWARFEWMYGHPEFDRNLLDRIGLWLSDEKVVGAAIYDMYLGEAFCAVLPEFELLYPAVLDDAYRTLRDDSGLAIAINDANEAEIDAARKAGFAPIAQDETLLRFDLHAPLTAALPDGLYFASLDPVRDEEALAWLFWQGFDHGTDRAAFEKEERPAPRLRRHYLSDLGVAAVNAVGEPVACCCVWMHPGVDYAYVEPVCTIPSYRGRGVGGAVVTEALRRAQTRGANCAYVISDQTFYRRLGFVPDSHYTFFRKA